LSTFFFKISCYYCYIL